MNKVLAIVLLAAVVAQAKFIPEVQDAIVRFPELMKMYDIGVEAHGKPQEADGKIVGGTLATAGQFPYQCRLIISYLGSSSLCGCSILSRTWVLTAAHCVDDSSIRSITVFAGETNSGTTESTQQSQTVSRHIVHGSWNVNTLRNDIALLQVPGFTFNDYVDCIRIATVDEGDSLVGTQTGRVSGFGKISDTTSTNNLYYVDVPFITNALCAATYGNSIASTNICTSTDGNKGTCSGDSGGPLISRTDSLQRGIVSFGSASGCTKAPSAFTRVSSYDTWITGYTGALSCQPRNY